MMNIIGKQKKKSLLERINSQTWSFNMANDFLDNLAAHQHEKMLREVAGDHKHDHKRQSLLSEEVVDDEDLE